MLSHFLVPHRPSLRLRGDLDRFDRLFDELWRGSDDRPTEFEPRIDVREGEDEISVRAELPGLEDKDFEVTVEGDLLTLKGEKRTEREATREGYSCVESRAGSFQRGFRLPWEVDAESVKAVYKNGVLTVTVPKPPKARTAARTIPVEVS